MSIKLNNRTLKSFWELTSEYCSEIALYKKDPKLHRKNADFIFGSTISVPTKEEYLILKERSAKNLPVVNTLFKNNKTVRITDSIATTISNKVSLTQDEICNLIDQSIFRFFNEIFIRQIKKNV